MTVLDVTAAEVAACPGTIPVPPPMPLNRYILQRVTASVGEVAGLGLDSSG